MIAIKIHKFLDVWRLLPAWFMIKANKQAKEYILEDINHWWKILNIGEDESLYSRFATLIFYTPEFRNLVYARMNQFGLKNKYVFKLFFPLKKTLHITTKELGHRIFIQHGDCTFLYAKSVGDDLWINQEVTVGFGLNGQPTIGNNVRLCVGAKVIGAITMGDCSTAGANAVIVKNVPPHETWGGIPAKRIK